MIPKIIHHTWRANNLPEIFDKLLINNKKINSDFEFKLWTHEPAKPEIEILIKNKFPELYNVYSKCKMGVQKADIGRLVILYEYGGLYLDLDILCLKSFNDIIDFNSNDIYFAYEPLEQSKKIFDSDNVLCNAFILTPINHPFFKKVIENIILLYTKYGDAIFTKFNFFGAPLISYTMNDLDFFKYIKFVNRNIIYPINDVKINDLSSFKNDVLKIKNGDYNNDVYCVHYWIHSDFESKDLIETFTFNDDLNIHINIYNFFKQLYPDKILN